MVLAENRHVNQWDRVETPDINPHSYNQLIFDRWTKTQSLKKGQSLQQVDLKTLNLHYESMK